MNKKIVSSIFATLLASLCCITPLIALLAGSSSIASSFSWMEPYRESLIVLTILVLLYAWWDKLKVKKDDIDCACDEKVSFFSSKKFLAIVTLFSIFMLSFPSWGYTYFEIDADCNTCTTEITPIKSPQTRISSSCSIDETCDDSIPKPIVKDTPLNPSGLRVLNYMKEEKNNPTNYKQQACGGTGFKETDALLHTARQEVQEMPPPVLFQILENDEEIILLDVREVAQRAEGEIYASESYAITRGNLEFNILNILKNKNALIVTYCRSGGLSLFGAQTLKDMGYTNVYNLKGGLKAWAIAGYPFDNGLGLVVKVESEE